MQFDSKGNETIQNIKRGFETFDSKKTGKLRLGVFSNIILFNCKTITEEMIMRFQSQYEKVYKDASVDYQSFIDEYLTDKQVKFPISKSTDLNINAILVKIATARKGSSINMSQALNFFNKTQTGLITVDNFKIVFAWIKAELTSEEFDYLLKFCLTEEGKVDIIKFDDQMKISNHNISVVYDRQTWLVAGEVIKGDLLEKVSSYTDSISFVMKQKIRENPPTVSLPLLPSNILHKALSNFKHEFTIKEIDDIVNYAIIGSQISSSEAQKKLRELEKTEITTEILNYDHFLQSLEDIISAKKEKGGSPSKTITAKPLSEEEARLKLDQKNLINKVKGILNERDVTLWDSIISSDMTITEHSKISLQEFGVILNSLNLGLTLKEKLMLERIADPTDSKKVDLKALIDIFEEKGLTERVMKVILEKLAIALFFNDMSFKAEFDYFDIDKDESISCNELIYGFLQQDLGLSIFEITQIAYMIEADKNGALKLNLPKDLKNYLRNMVLNLLKTYPLMLTQLALELI